MNARSWLVYGAYGYTGELIAREAIRRGLRPTLAGRRQAPLESLAGELDLPFRVLALDDSVALDQALAETAAVLHCAGPFSRTSAPMVDACLRKGCHYLDITGEISVFESVFRRHDDARHAGVVLLPGVGLDVVPTDCLAAHLGSGLPSATHLDLALDTAEGSVSPGTLSTMIEGIPDSGAARVAGKLVAQPLAADQREIEFSHRRRWAMTIPWGDLSTAYRTTGIPNIRVYLATSPQRVARLRRLAPLLPLLGAGPVKKTLQWLVRSRVSGPSAETRERAKSYFWGAVRDDRDETRTATLTTPEGYRLTAMTAVECMTRALAGEVPAGTWTPAQAFGADFIKQFDGVAASW